MVQICNESQFFVCKLLVDKNNAFIKQNNLYDSKERIDRPSKYKRKKLHEEGNKSI